MSRSKSLNVQTPGAPPSADDLQAQAAAGTAADDAEQTQDLTVDSDDVVALKVKLAELEARNAELQADIDSKKKSSVIYEPETPHGKERLEASATKDMTVAQVMQAIKARRLENPMTSYLCKDGNLCRIPDSMIEKEK